MAHYILSINQIKENYIQIFQNSQVDPVHSLETLPAGVATWPSNFSSDICLQVLRELGPVTARLLCLGPLQSRLQCQHQVALRVQSHCLTQCNVSLEWQPVPLASESSLLERQEGLSGKL